MDFLQPGIGEEVCVRRRRYLIRGIDIHTDCRVLTLHSLSTTDAQRPMHVIEPFDDVRVIRRHGAPSFVGPRQWQFVCRALMTEDGSTDSLMTAADAAIELLPFQLEPAIALLKGFGSRVLIADEVGLGKTVQALLAVTELRARGLVTRVLIVCPAGLRDQWADECEQRFGVSFCVADHHSLRRTAAQLPHGVNPWTTLPLSIVSVDYLKRPEVLAAAASVPWDLVVVDEVHGSCGPSERQDAVAHLTARAQYVVLLTATPHNGDPGAFETLCSIGAHDDRLIVFRRSRRDVGHDGERRIHINRVSLTAPEQRMHAALAALTDAIRRERLTSESRAWLVLSVLCKRALSGGHALATSVTRRLTLLGEAPGESGAQLGLPFFSEEGDGSDAPPMWSEPALHDLSLELTLLEQLLDAARAAAQADSKVAALKRLLTRWREPAIVFSEYRDTLLDLKTRLDRDAAVIHGGLSRSERQSALAEFRGLGLLLATDAAGEGLNLHENCRTIINLELPWNPMRLEQRIGRVDRIGQRRRVHVIHLVSASTGETRLLHRLGARVRRAGRSIPTSNPLGKAPAWTEADSARLVMFPDSMEEVNRGLELGDEAAASGASATEGNGGPRIQALRLPAEGDCEARRVTFVRELRAHTSNRLDHGTHVSARRLPLVVRPARPKLRRVLAGRSLAIYRVVISDAFGRRVATRVLGLAVKDPLRTPRLDFRADDVEDAARHALVAATADWFEVAVQLHRNVCAVRAARAGSIIRFVERQPRIWQPGLFERRAEHQRAQDEGERARVLEDARARLREVQGAVESYARTFELVLIAGLTERSRE